MQQLQIKRVILFDGTQTSTHYEWDKNLINNLQDGLKEILISKYGSESISKDFHVVIFSIKGAYENEMMQIKLDQDGIEQCNWLTSIINQNYVNFPYNDIMDETGTILDGTIVFCDYWWRNLDTQVFEKYSNSNISLDSNNRVNTSIVDKIFELAMNNPNVIFIPYDSNSIDDVVDYVEDDLKQEDSILCKVIYPFTFSGEKSRVILYFKKFILERFPTDLLLIKNTRKGIVKELINTRNREDTGITIFM